MRSDGKGDSECCAGVAVYSKVFFRPDGERTFLSRACLPWGMYFYFGPVRMAMPQKIVYFKPSYKHDLFRTGPKTLTCCFRRP